MTPKILITTDREQEMALTTSATNWDGDDDKKDNNSLKDYVLFSFIASY